MISGSAPNLRNSAAPSTDFAVEATTAPTPPSTTGHNAHRAIWEAFILDRFPGVRGEQFIHRQPAFAGDGFVDFEGFQEVGAVDDPFAIFKDGAVEAQPDHLEGFTPGAATPRCCSGDASGRRIGLVGNLTADVIEIIPGLWLCDRDACAVEQIFAIVEGEGAATGHTDQLATHFCKGL